MTTQLKVKGKWLLSDYNKQHVIKYLHFAMYLCIITLQIDFVINSPMHFISDYLNINHTIIENYIDISNLSLNIMS